MGNQILFYYQVQTISNANKFPSSIQSKFKAQNSWSVFLDLCAIRFSVTYSYFDPGMKKNNTYFSVTKVKKKNGIKIQKGICPILEYFFQKCACVFSAETLKPHLHYRT